jgi:hypothetical protein
MLLVGGGTVRGDLGIPVFKVQSETEAGFRPPDSPPCRPTVTSTDLAGRRRGPRRPHFSDGGGQREPRPIPPHRLACATRRGSEVRSGPRFRRHDLLVRWVRNGTPPPTAPRIETVSPTPPTTIARDELGLALGGIRHPDIAAPTALNTGQNGGPAFCVLFGTHIPFDEATLDALYPSRADYLGDVFFSTLENLVHGYIGMRAAAVIVTDALKSDVGK